MISVIVNFCNNRREARNTLHSLSSAYQRGAEGIDYAVVALDNGSSQPLEAAEVRSFGPQLQHRFVATTSKSPAAAINQAARAAAGEELLVLIDGAHIVTPGVIATARRAYLMGGIPVEASAHAAASANVGCKYWLQQSAPAIDLFPTQTAQGSRP